MAKRKASVDSARVAALRLAGELQLELIDVELVKENTSRFLRFFVDKPGGITIDDCEVYHKRLQPLVEEIDYDFMEVSSPGVDRPLKKPEDYARAIGEVVEVHLYKAQNGSKVFSGVLLGLLDGFIALQSEEGNELRFDLKQIALAKPLIEFEESDLEDLLEPPNDGKGFE